MKKRTVLVSIALLFIFAVQSSASAPVLPNPVLYFLGQEFLTINGKQVTRYNFDVLNKSDYPDELFAASPNLPPCGSNTNSARTWVEIEYRELQSQQPHRIYGFCALGSPQDLTRLWFALPNTGQKHPSPVYVVLNDRATTKKYVSNPVDIYAPPVQTKPGGTP